MNRSENRILAIVDLENACGGSVNVPLYQADVRAAVELVSCGAPPLVVFSTGPQALALAPTLLWEWSAARFVLGRGINGADNALIDVLRSEPLARRSSRVVLVSGDHAFATPVAELRDRGIPTTVLCTPRSLSRDLQTVADRISWLPDYSQSTCTATNAGSNKPSHLKETR